MISPQTYICRFKSAKYTDLIRERDRLIDELRKFEKNEMTGEEWLMDPEVRYQCSWNIFRSCLNLCVTDITMNLYEEKKES